MRDFTAPHRSRAGSYSSTTSVLLEAVTWAAPRRPPITYMFPFTTPENAWLRAVDIGLRFVHVLVAGSYIWLVPRIRAGRSPNSAAATEFSMMVEPPMKYIFKR